MPGTCGELVQGTLGGVPCLVSCPIDYRSELILDLRPGSGRVYVPSDMGKTRQALRLALAETGCSSMDVVVTRKRALPKGKGYASSTADILGAIFALGRLLGCPFSPEAATRLAISVEPTDSIAWEGLALLAHRDGRIMRLLGPAPPLAVLVLDWGGIVDTISFNNIDHSAALSHLAPIHKDAFAMLEAGIARRDPALIGQAATMSALAQQTILHKPQLDAVLRAARRVGALGVCVAHSGSLIGVLLKVEEAQELLPCLLRQLPGRPKYWLHRVTGGGPSWNEGMP